MSARQTLSRAAPHSDSPSTGRIFDERIKSDVWAFYTRFGRVSMKKWRGGVVSLQSWFLFLISKIQLLTPLKSQKREGYCWRTPQCRKMCVPHAFFKGKKKLGKLPREK